MPEHGGQGMKTLGCIRITGLPALVGIITTGLLLSGCSSDRKLDPFAGKGSPVYSKSGPIPKGGGRHHVGKPYTVAGRTFYPTANPEPVQVGVASWYGPRFHRRRTANGEWFDMNYLSAAHPTMPLPSYARVTNLENGRTVIVRVNDRGPFVGTRIMDLSRAAAERLGYLRQGKARVRVEYLGPAPLGDDRRLLARLNRMTDASKPTLLAAIDGRAIDAPPVRVARNRPPQPPVRTAAAGAAAMPRQVRPAGYAPLPGYFVQVAAFINPDNAEAARRRLGRIGPVDVRPVEVAARRFWRVRLGPLASLEDAEDLLGRVRSIGHHDARIVISSN